MPCVQEKREEYQRAQREKEEREVEEKKQAAREQVQHLLTYMSDVASAQLYTAYMSNVNRISTLRTSATVYVLRNL